MISPSLSAYGPTSASMILYISVTQSGIGDSRSERWRADLFAISNIVLCPASIVSHFDLIFFLDVFDEFVIIKVRYCWKHIVA